MENDMMLGEISGKRIEESQKKMAAQCEHHKRTFHQHEIGRQRSRQMEKYYRGCRQGSDTTRWHRVTKRILGIYLLRLYVPYDMSFSNCLTFDFPYNV